MYLSSSVQVINNKQNSFVSSCMFLSTNIRLSSLKMKNPPVYILPRYSNRLNWKWKRYYHYLKRWITQIMIYTSSLVQKKGWPICRQSGGNSLLREIIGFLIIDFFFLITAKSKWRCIICEFESLS